MDNIIKAKIEVHNEYMGLFQQSLGYENFIEYAQKQIEELESDRTSEVGVSLPKQWQKCPLCNGDGIIAVPILETVNSTHQICSVCNGKKIILMG